MITEKAWSAIQPDLERQTGRFCQLYGIEPSFVEDVLQTVWIIAHTNYDPSRGKLLRFCTDVGRNLIIDRARNNAVHRRYVGTLETLAMADLYTQAIFGLLREREKEVAEARWQSLIEMLASRQYLLELEILETMRRHLMIHDEIPSRRQIGRALGKHHSSVDVAVRKIVKALEKEEACQEEKTPPISSPSGS